MPGSTTTPGRPSARGGAPEHVAFRYTDGVGGTSFLLNGSMAGLPVPLPTLRRRPHGRLRTAPGPIAVCYSFIVRRGLAPPTPCQSPGAPV